MLFEAMARDALWDLVDAIWEDAPLADRHHALGATGWPRLLTVERKLRGALVEASPEMRAVARVWLAYADALALGNGPHSLPRACLAVALGREGYIEVLRGTFRIPVHAFAPTLLALLLSVEDAPPVSTERALSPDQTGIRQRSAR